MTDKLRIIKKDNKPKESSSFWNCCPLKLEYLPKEHCDQGKPELNVSDKNFTPPPCAWWLNSPENNYCFWKFIKSRSNKDGQMPELMQSDLAKLFGWSNTKAHFILKEAIDELVQVLKKHGLDEDLDYINEEIALEEVNVDELSEDSETY